MKKKNKKKLPKKMRIIFKRFLISVSLLLIASTYIIIKYIFTGKVFSNYIDFIIGAIGIIGGIFMVYYTNKEPLKL